MEKLKAFLRGFNHGDWIAFAVVASALTWVLWNTTGTFWNNVVYSLQPALPDSNDLTRADVIAQRSMAAAAWWMVIITGVSVAVGGLGLYLIARTLQEAKRSADAAHNAVDATMLIGKRQVRAYLELENATAKIDRNHFILTVDAHLINAGQSPARHVNGTAVLRFVEFFSLPDGEVGTETLQELTTTFRTAAVSAGKKVDLFVTFGIFNLKPPLRIIIGGSMHRAVQIEVSFEYTDVFDDTWTVRRLLGSFISDLEKMEAGFPLRVSSPEQ